MEDGLEPGCGCSVSGCCESGLSADILLTRRKFLASVALAGVASAFESAQAASDLTATPGDPIPASKNLNQTWITSLTERGTPEKYTGKSLEHIGMPIGGLCAGELYLGGDGKLWRWNIFNGPNGSPSNGDRYVQPGPRDYPIDQGFSLTVHAPGISSSHSLDSSGFSDISFVGQYPMAFVEYADQSCPLKVSLTAFSPFIPLDFDRSSFPATVLRYSVKNTSSGSVQATLSGWMENGVCLNSRSQAVGSRRNSIISISGGTALAADFDYGNFNGTVQPEIIFEDWNKTTYTGWTVEGTAFGSGPIKRTDMPAYQGDVGGDTDRVVNSHATASGSVEQRDAEVGKLTSAPFTISRKFIRVWIGGGNHPGQTCFNVLVDGAVVSSNTGQNNNNMSQVIVDLSKYVGRSAVIQIVDNATGPWGNIGVGRITFTDLRIKVDALPDFGTMSLTLLGKSADQTSTMGGVEGLNPGLAAASISDFSKPLVGSLARSFTLHPDESVDLDFIIAWRFPNLQIDGLPNHGNYYGSKYSTSLDVTKAVISEFHYLCSTTDSWRRTWYDSTLPYWFLNRTMANTGVVSTTTAFRFGDGRFYSWEGVGCCPGTCTHVWHYAQALARLFPEVERHTREHTDLGVGFDTSSGVIGFRAEFDRGLAVDGQAGTILRFYREHQMSASSDFLIRNWPKIKLSFDPLFNLDQGKIGILQRAQMNTLDQPWFGKNSWQSSLYVAALRAGAAMASEMGDREFSAQCTALAESGTKFISSQLFDGEYFYNRVDSAHLDATNSGTGCHIDQVLGQSWAHQVGLPRILPKDQTVSALKALWKYNFAPDVGPWRKINQPGRWYAVAGEAGLVMTTFPRSGWSYDNAKGSGPEWATGYFNECMTGFEHQAAGHMIAEGLVFEGLAVERAIHDRYNASKRNPYNEIECGDHYSRSMASYGAFITACGYEYHGPNKSLKFDPKLSSENAKFAFTSAEGWGSYSQKIVNGVFTAEITLVYGRLAIEKLTLAIPVNKASRTKLLIAGKAIVPIISRDGKFVTIILPEHTALAAGESLKVEA